VTVPLRLGVLATHPIQYYSPLYRRLAAEPGVDVAVHFAHRPTPEEQGVGFGVAFEWDTDLLGGYEHRFLSNVAAHPGTSHFSGCDTPEIADIIRRERYDAFLLMGWHARSYWQAMLACWRTGTPVLVRSDSQLPTDRSGWKRAVKRALYPRFLSRCAAALAVGTRSEEYLRYYGARRVVRSPHFVDGAHFAREAAAIGRVAARARWRIPDGSLVCLFAGKLVPKKRPLDVVRAVARLEGVDARLLVAGDSEPRGAVEREAEALGVRLHLAGFLNQTEIPAAYAAADVLALPSDERETWGLVVNEAMASGRPAIVSRAAGCAPDLVVEGKTGFSHPVGDVDALAAALRTLAADRGAAERLGRAAAEHVAGFSVERAAAGVLEACLTTPARPEVAA
jgi:glycosyltransferase involved in cell wall biosynthesis